MLIDNRYSVEEELGRGGMGVVYRCRDQVLDKFVAVKLLQPMFDVETQAARFHRECVINAKLKHKNIIEVLDFGQTEKGELFLVSEFLEGETLDNYLRRNGSLRLKEALPIFAEIIDGLEYAHNHGVLHRDVKPGNIMVLSDQSVSRIKVMDLGIAYEADSEQRLTTPGASIGTPCYIAPEQALGKPIDLRADLYSFGCLMFEVLAGAPPYSDKEGSVVETILMHKNEPIPKLKDFGVTEYGEPLDKILSRCLAKEAADRYASMGEVRTALEQLADQGDRCKQFTISGGTFSPRRGARDLGWVLLFLALVGAGTWAIWTVAGSGTEVDESEAGKESLSAPLLEGKQMSVDEKVRRNLEKAYSVSIDQKDDGPKMYRIHGHVNDRRLKDVVKDLPDIRYLTLHGDAYDGDGFAYFGALHLQGLILCEDEITDKGLRNIAQLPGLEELVIERCEGFTNEGLESLSKAPKLESLRIEDGIDDTSVATLASISNLQHLGLQHSSALTGATIGLLKKLGRLNYLELQGSGFQAKYLKDLATLKGLRKLDLSSLQISDKDLPAIMSLKLKSLKLQDNNITDEGLRTLSKMSSLEKLDLSDCAGISRSGGQNFNRALPDCTLKYDPCDRLDLVPERP